MKNNQKQYSDYLRNVETIYVQTSRSKVHASLTAGYTIAENCIKHLRKNMDGLKVYHSSSNCPNVINLQLVLKMSMFLNVRPTTPAVNKQHSYCLTITPMICHQITKCQQAVMNMFSYMPNNIHHDIVSTVLQQQKLTIDEQSFWNQFCSKLLPMTFLKVHCLLP